MLVVKEEAQEEKRQKSVHPALNYVGNKAGMQGLDKEAIAAKIIELSKEVRLTMIERLKGQIRLEKRLREGLKEFQTFTRAKT